MSVPFDHRVVVTSVYAPRLERRTTKNGPETRVPRIPGPPTRFSQNRTDAPPRPHGRLTHEPRKQGGTLAQRLTIRTSEREQLLDITPSLRELLQHNGMTDGVVHLWPLHTTCGITVNEGADPDVAADIVAVLRQIVPRTGDYLHAEGNSDSHVKTSLFGPGLSVPVENGEPLLGTWQRLFLAEWDGPRIRTIAAVFTPAA